MDIINHIVSRAIKYPDDATQVLISFLLLAIAFKKRNYFDITLKIFCIYLIWLFFKNVVGFLTASYRVNNLLLYNFSLPIELGILVKMIQTLFFKSYQKRSLIIVFVAFVIFFLVDFLISNAEVNPFDLHILRMNKYSYAVQDMLVMILILYYLYRTLVEVNVPNLLNYPIFWICCGLLISHSVSVFTHIFYYETNTWKKVVMIGNLKYIPIILGIIESIFFGIGLLLVKKTNDK